MCPDFRCDWGQKKCMHTRKVEIVSYRGIYKIVL